MYDFNLMFVTLSTNLTINVHNCNSIWCYWIKCCVDNDELGWDSGWLDRDVK
jgi:hypothetical protein